MKTTIRLLTVFVLTWVTLGKHTNASAGGGLGFNFKGPTAIASFLNTVGCTMAEVLIIASEARVQDEPDKPALASFASASILQTDTCTGEILLQASGTTSPLSKGDLQISATLGSASLDTTISVFDEVSQSTLDIDIHLTWTATGSLNRDQSNSQIHTPGCITNSHFVGLSRPAEASGRISDRSTNFAGNSVSIKGTSLSSVTSGIVTRGCS